jgi:rhodanese-related sulfurtransferase
MPRQDPGEPYFRVDSVEAKQILDDDPENTIVVDVRRDDEWVTGHATGAVHIPIDDFADRIAEVPQDKRLLFICAAGVRSGLACELASSFGYDTDNLINVEDGTPSWIAAGNPTSYGNDP